MKTARLTCTVDEHGYCEECGDTHPKPEYDHVWRVHTRMPGRFGEHCRVLARGAMNTIAVEFESDHYRVTTSRNFVRLLTNRG